MSKTTKFEFEGTTYQVSTDASDSAILLPNGKVVQGQWSEKMPPRLDGTTVREVPGYEGQVVPAVALVAVKASQHTRGAADLTCTVTPDRVDGMVECMRESGYSKVEVG